MSSLGEPPVGVAASRVASAPQSLLDSRGAMSHPRPTDEDEPTVVGDMQVVPSVRRNQKPFVLQQIEGPGSPRDYILDLDEIVIGRSSQAHISIDSGMISRRHMVLQRSGPEYSVSDLNSSNGVFLNGIKAHSAVLREGDTLQIGDVVLIYREGG